MARVNISLPDDLHRRVKDAGVPISEVCQKALRQELAERDARKQVLGDSLWSGKATNRRP